ncbi:50S ribosomal protein L3 [Candidatus Babeliales bacterium]|nr:50S ribosomal protein L3 [Candidatus Babeliales bacterium]
MVKELLGTKIGMTQLFDKQRNVVPVTVIDMNGWFVTQVKTEETDKYSALQLGLVKKRYRELPFSGKWLQDKKQFFAHVHEVCVDEKDAKAFSVGQKVALENLDVSDKDDVAVAGTSRGLGFQGVVKRWGFKGGPSGHGSTFHRKPGSIGNMCSEGNVIKGKKLPGHAGCQRVTVKGLRVVKVDPASNYLFVKGAVPGKKNSLLFICKQG